MNNFNRGNSRGRSGGFGRNQGSQGRGGWGRSNSAPMMHKAKCAECGSNCEVPFKPNGRKPILCSNCFGGNIHRGNERDFKARGPARHSSGPKPEHKNTHDDAILIKLRTINEKVDQILQILSEAEVEVTDEGYEE